MVARLTDDWNGQEYRQPVPPTLLDIGDKERTHTIAVLVVNEPGVLARVIGLFSGRGYNIESLTVATVRTATSRAFTVVTSGTPMIIEQIKAQLDRLVPGQRRARPDDGRPVMSSGKWRWSRCCTRRNGEESLRIADIFRARAVDSTPSICSSRSPDRRKIDAFIDLMRAGQGRGLSRTGVVAIARGPVDACCTPAAVV